MVSIGVGSVVSDWVVASQTNINKFLMPEAIFCFCACFLVSLVGLGFLCHLSLDD